MSDVAPPQGGPSGSRRFRRLQLSALPLEDVWSDSLQLWDTALPDSTNGQGAAHPQMISHAAMITAMYEEIVRLRAQCQQQEERLRSLESQMDWRGMTWPSVRHAVQFEIDP